MIWTRDDVTIHAHPVSAGGPLIDRRKNTAILYLTKDEALALMCEIGNAFGVEGVPSSAAFETVTVVIEGLPQIYAKSEDD